MRTLIVTLLVALLPMAATLSAAPADDVRAAETAFAKAFADRDSARFVSFLAPDAKFLQKSGALTGKDQIMSKWGPWLKLEKAPFSWRPERVEVNGAGDIGLSAGPVFDDTGAHVADYYSIWEKQKDGTWKIIFDGPGTPVCPSAQK
jgi:ketosteroid isomerase-like protein